MSQIFIELQPMGTFSKNLKTKILSHILQYLFMNEFQVIFINSKKKLKKVLQGEKISYAKLKKLSIEHTITLLKENIFFQSENEKWLQYFLKEKNKKDDLADCFLQGIYGYNKE